VTRGINRSAGADLSFEISFLMNRAWRIEYEAALHDWMSRGNEGRDIFIDRTDRAKFLDTVGEMSERYEFDIFTYVLTGNPYHLLVRSPQANLKNAMQYFPGYERYVVHGFRQLFWQGKRCADNHDA
jgi:hypothetical protein